MCIKFNLIFYLVISCSFVWGNRFYCENFRYVILFKWILSLFLMVIRDQECPEVKKIGEGSTIFSEICVKYRPKKKTKFPKRGYPPRSGHHCIRYHNITHCCLISKAMMMTRDCVIWFIDVNLFLFATLIILIRCIHKVHLYFITDLSCRII